MIARGALFPASFCTRCNGHQSQHTIHMHNFAFRNLFGVWIFEYMDPFELLRFLIPVLCRLLTDFDTSNFCDAMRLTGIQR